MSEKDSGTTTKKEDTAKYAKPVLINFENSISNDDILKDYVFTDGHIPQASYYPTSPLDLDKLWAEV